MLRMTQEEKDFLKSLAFGELTFLQICDEYWKKFKNGRTKSSLLNWFYKKLNLKGFNPQNCYTKEEHDYIKENMNKFRKNGKFDEEGFLKDYNSKFEHKLNHDRLVGLRNRLNVKVGEPDFKELVKTQNRSKHKIGSEVIRHGQVYVKVNHIVGDRFNKNDLWKLNWKCKARYLYEQYHNVVLQEDEVVIFLDKNNRNFSKDNLYVITRNVQGPLCHYQHIHDVELRKTAIKICELEQQIKKAGI